MPPFSTPLVLATALVLALGAAKATAQFAPMSAARDLDSGGVIFAFQWPMERTALRAEAFTVPLDAPLSLSAFLPAAELPVPGSPLEGRLKISGSDLSVAWLGAGPPKEFQLPELHLDLVGSGDRIIPIQPSEDIVLDGRQPLTLIFGVGRNWQEPSDEGLSRAVLPVALIDLRGDRGPAVYNGLAGFMYGEDKITAMLFQFSQETAPGRQANLWGTFQTAFSAGPVADAKVAIEQSEQIFASAATYLDWDALSDPPDWPDDPAVSVSALVDDRTVYLQACRTRHGPYPFCRQMRHALGQASMGMHGFAALAHISRRLGPDVVAIPLETQDLATGASDPPPGVRALDLANLARPGAASVDLDSMQSDYDLLAIALDAQVKRRMGPEASLAWFMGLRIYTRLGIPQIPMVESRSDTPRERIADLMTGLVPSTDELVRLILEMRDAQETNRISEISGPLARDALSTDPDLGLPTQDGERFHLGFWRRPVVHPDGCSIAIPEARGAGGTVVTFLPDMRTAFRLADGPPDTPAPNLVLLDRSAAVC